MYELYQLSNGLRVITEHIPYVRSASVGLWIAAGSMHERPEENGLSHFLEHMLFKGTERRSARDIAEEMDAVGGQLNAFTSKECTCYYAKVMDEHLSMAVDLLCDLVRNATLDEGELNKERSVILEEIAMVEDSPEDLVHESLTEVLLQGNPLAQPILGPANQIEAYPRAALAAYRQTHYRPDNMVISVAGNFNAQALREQIERYMGDWTTTPPPQMPQAGKCFTPALMRKNKDIEQIHLCLGFPGIEYGSPDIYALSIFNNLFGGGMSSRLFQRIREELGMAYSVYSYPTVMPGCGLFVLYAGTSSNHVQSVLEQLRREIALLLSDGISPESFRMAREQLKGSYILGLESPSSRMSNIGRNLLLQGRVRDEQEVLDSIAAVTMEDVMRVAQDMLSKPNGASIVGRGVDSLPEEWLLGK